MIASGMWVAALLGCSGGTVQVGESDSAVDSDVDSDVAPASCDDPGTPTTPTPAPSTDADGVNVTALACTRTAVALACELGVEHAYAESVSGGKRTITANGVVDHDVGPFPNDGNPNVIAAQTYTYTVPVTPSGAGSTQQGVFGVLFSGAVLDPGTAETWNDDRAWSYEALRYGTATGYFDSDGNMHPTSLGVDCNLAHVQPTGAYHYHGLPTSLIPETPAVTQVGWAADGAPVVARYGHEVPTDGTSAVRAMNGSYRVRSGVRPGGPGGSYDGTFVADWEYVAGLGDLDACNGRTETLTVDGAPVTTYVYYLTDNYPFIPRCFTFTPDASFARGGGGGGGGGEVPPCGDGQTDHCCGDGVCDGPENADNCPADCG
jgi:hypothetical protein